MMLDNFGVSEESWRDALDPSRAGRHPPPPTSRSPSRRDTSGAPSRRWRRIADRARWNQKSVSSGRLAREYGFTDVDGSRPDIWRYIEEMREPGLQADLDAYR